LSFLVWTLLSLAVAAGMGVLLYLAYMGGFYLIMIAPLLGALVGAGIVYLAVRQAHCRNRVLAGALGLVAGMVLYLGYYDAGLVNAIGLRNAHRVDVLPLYVKLRMQADVVEKVGAKPAPGRANAPDRVIMNWMLFALELAGVCAIMAVAGVHRAGFPYSEPGARWMREEMAIFPPGTGAALVEALETGLVAAWADAQPERASPTMPFSNITLHYDPERDRHQDAAPVYLTVKETRTVKQGLLVKKPMPKVETLVNRVRLTPDEVRALQPVFAGLRVLDSAEPAPQPATFARERPVVQVEPVSEPYAGQVLSPGHRRRCQLRLAGLLALIAAGPVLLIAALALAVRGAGLQSLWYLVPAILCMFGGIVCLGSLLKAAVAIQRHSARSLYRAASHQFRSRPDLLVDPDDPEAIFIEVVPRRNWARANRTLETASDVGFLRIDAQRGLLLFEGDRDRYRIPAGAVLGCEVEQVEPHNSFMTQTDHYPHFVAVVRANHPDGPWEAPLAVRHDERGLFTGKSHQARALELRERILVILPPGEDADVS
jgi:hypothetical protein